MKPDLLKYGVLLSALIALSGCDLGMDPETSPFDEEGLAQELDAYRPVLQDFDALMALGNSPDASRIATSSDIGASAVAPPWDETQTTNQVQWAEIFLTDPADTSSWKTPAVLFAEYESPDDGDTNRAEIPGETGDAPYIADYYAVGDQLRFVMTDLDPQDPDSNYRVEVYSYPRTNFSILFTYEEYYVSPTEWTYYTDAGATTQGYATLETHYADGMVGERTVEEAFFSDSGTFYPAFAFGELVATETQEISDGTILGTAPLYVDLGGSLSDYVYTQVESTPPTATATTGQYSSHVTESANGDRGSKLDSWQYYTEPDGDSAYGLTYSTYKRNGRWATAVNNVSRTSRTSDGSGETAVTRVLSTTGNIGSIWESNVTETSVSRETDGNIRYESVYIQWWEDVTDGSAGTPSYESTLVLTQSDDEGRSYEGYKVYGWNGSNDMVDEVSLTHNSDGSYTMTTTYRWDVSIGSSAIGSSATAVQPLSMTVSGSDGSLRSVSWEHNGGELVLTYEQGGLIGSYTKAGDSIDVLIRPEGIGVGDAFYRGANL